MTGAEIALVCALGAAIAGVGAVAGGNSLVAVPMLIFFGLSPSSAVATNMVGVGALSLGAALRFSHGGHVDRHPTLPLTLLAIPGSILGALIAVELPSGTFELIIAVAMLSLVAFLLLRPSWGDEHVSITRRRMWFGYVVTTIWGIYGGLFSGGYATVLTFLIASCFGSTLLQSIATTKWVNVASSAVAVAVFAHAGVVDWTIAAPYSVTTLIGGALGASWATHASSKHLRQVLIIVVAAIAVLMLWRVLFAN